MRFGHFAGHRPAAVAHDRRHAHVARHRLDHPPIACHSVTNTPTSCPLPSTDDTIGIPHATRISQRRRSNPRRACGIVTAQRLAGSLLGGFRTPAPTPVAPSPWAAIRTFTSADEALSAATASGQTSPQCKDRPRKEPVFVFPGRQSPLGRRRPISPLFVFSRNSCHAALGGMRSSCLPCRFLQWMHNLRV